MSKILKKLLKYSILPASLMVASKIVGLIIAIQMRDISISVNDSLTDLFSFSIEVLSTSDQLYTNTFSDSIMLATITASTFLIISKYSLLLQSGNDPKTIVKLTKLNILSWVTDKNTAFIKVFTWSIFLLATCAIITVNAFTEQTYMTLGVISFIISIINLWILFRMFEFELDKIYPENQNVI